MAKVPLQSDGAGQDRIGRILSLMGGLLQEVGTLVESRMDVNARGYLRDSGPGTGTTNGLVPEQAQRKMMSRS